MGFRKMDGKFPPKFVKIRLFWPLLDDFWGLLHKESGPPRVVVWLSCLVKPTLFAIFSPALVVGTGLAKEILYISLFYEEVRT
jgi:hypothetical protein